NNKEAELSDLTLENIEASAQFPELFAFLYDSNGIPVYNTNPGTNQRMWTGEKGFPQREEHNYARITELRSNAGGGSAAVSVLGGKCGAEGSYTTTYEITRDIHVTKLICEGATKEGCYDMMTVVG
ncbi:MAG: hypothetical protein HUJ97_09070, partial [Bacteroidales bacterium]|nr:hypothetical protein [Bacteroidales bacterium]